MSKATIFVKFNSAHFHHWPDPPLNRIYLKSRHRHQFHVEVQCVVDHDDREIEFHDLLDFAKDTFVMQAFNAGSSHTDSRSCEMMGRDLGEVLQEKFRRPFLISVSEDNECGAVVGSSQYGGPHG